MLRAGIVGATGYSGLELIRIISNHPEAKINRLYSSSSEGAALSSLFPHLQDLTVPHLEKIDAEEIAADNDVVFLATPAGVSAELTPQLLSHQVKVIDLSGDFRLRSASAYTQWYKKVPASQALLNQAVFGLHEWNAEKIANAELLANPGCYPTATLLGILPLAKSGWASPRSWIIDAKSGVSGAGRGVSLGVHYSEVNENLAAYKIGVHQHTPEIEQELAVQTGQDMLIQFTPHLIPMTRGILITAYATLSQSVTEADIQELYEETYADNPFVRIKPLGSYPRTKEVYGSNYCDIAIHLDQRTGRVIIISVIDNVVKGAAGQAVQNMNTMFGLKETTGLTMAPVFP